MSVRSLMNRAGPEGAGGWVRWASLERAQLDEPGRARRCRRVGKVGVT